MDPKVKHILKVDHGNHPFLVLVKLMVSCCKIICIYMFESFYMFLKHMLPENHLFLD